MRKAIITVCILTLILSSFSMSFAATADEATEVEQLRFVGTLSHSEGLSISSSGKASMLATLIPKSETSIDEVEVTIKLKHTDGTTVLNKTYDAEWSDTYFQFRVYDSKNLTKTGLYTMSVTYKCYKNGSLIETLTGSNSDTY